MGFCVCVNKLELPKQTLQPPCCTKAKQALPGSGSTRLCLLPLSQACLKQASKLVSLRFLGCFLVFEAWEVIGSFVVGLEAFLAGWGGSNAGNH